MRFRIAHNTGQPQAAGFACRLVCSYLTCWISLSLQLLVKNGSSGL